MRDGEQSGGQPPGQLGAAAPQAAPRRPVAAGFGGLQHVPSLESLIPDSALTLVENPAQQQPGSGQQQLGTDAEAHPQQQQLQQQQRGLAELEPEQEQEHQHDGGEPSSRLGTLKRDRSPSPSNGALQPCPWPEPR